MPLTQVTSGLITSVANTQITGIMTVAQGGTGTNTLATNNVILGNGTSSVQVVAPGTSGNVLTSSGTTWTSSAVPSSSVIRSARTSNTILAAADKGNLISITSGTFTQTFTAAATLGSGWFCYIQNAGTGDITLDPNASETIDGRTTYIMYPGEVRLVQCDGTALRTIVLNAFYRTFTASGTFTVPPGYTVFEGLLWGAGGSGSKGHQGGGGGGACVPFALSATAVLAGTTSLTVTVAAASTGPSTAGTRGPDGGNSSISGAGLATVTAYGGAGGYFDSNEIYYGGGGGGALSAPPAAATNSFNGGQPRTSGVNSGFGGGDGAGQTSLGSSAYGGAGGGVSTISGSSSLYGGAGGGGGSAAGASTGGTSVFGGAGGAGSITGSGTNGTAPGGGGGATHTGTKGGDGARGELRIWGVI